MSKQPLSKEEADQLMKIKGNIRGTVFYTHAVYIRHREGEKGIEAVEKRLKELGYPLKLDEMKDLEWYQEALSVLVILVAKEIFKWSDADIFDMGNSGPKYSFVAKLLMKYFLSLQKGLDESPKYWQKHFDFGEIEPYKVDEKEKYVVLRIRGYKFHPIICIYHAGYFQRIGQYLMKNKEITIEETGCVFKGDPYHEYIMRWK